MSQGSNPQTNSFNPIKSIIGVVAVVAVLYLLFMIVKGIFSLLAFASPVLIIASFFLDKTVVFDYVKFLGNKIKTNPLVGIGFTVLTFIAFPVVALYIFLKSLAKNKINKKVEEYQAAEQGEYAEFEEVEDDFLTLPKLEKPTITRSQSKSDDGYDDVF